MWRININTKLTKRRIVTSHFLPTWVPHNRTHHRRENYRIEKDNK